MNENTRINQEKKFPRKPTLNRQVKANYIAKNHFRASHFFYAFKHHKQLLFPIDHPNCTNPITNRDGKPWNLEKPDSKFLVKQVIVHQQILFPNLANAFGACRFYKKVVYNRIFQFIKFFWQSIGIQHVIQNALISTRLTGFWSVGIIHQFFIIFQAILFSYLPTILFISTHHQRTFVPAWVLCTGARFFIYVFENKIFGAEIHL